MTREADPLAGAEQTAHEWLAVIAEQLGTEDRSFTYRALKVWLHLVRDRLTVEAAVNFAAQLPEILRGVFFEGWVPRTAPVKYDTARFTEAFADRADIRPEDVPAVAGAISAGLRDLCAPGQVGHVLAMMPAELRGELQGETPRPELGRPAPGVAQPSRLDALEESVLTLTEAVSALVRGLEVLPAQEPADDRTARAAQEAHRILLAHSPVRT